MTYYVYILENDAKRHYIGFTGQDIEQRLCEHNSGKCPWTKTRGPWKIVHCEEFTSYEEAQSRERQLKRFKGGRALKALFQ